MAANQSQRPKFYEEQYLGAADLTAAVDYGRVQQARHMLGAHTWGIAIGLQLKETPQPGGAVSVHLLPGYAWDGYGRPIVVLSPYKIPEEKFNAYRYTDGSTLLIPVWLRYDELATQSPRPGFEVCETEEQRSRIQETFRIEIGEQPNTTDRYAGVTIAAKLLSDAKTALRAFDPQGTPVEAPFVYDESIPQQTFPEPQNRARWLVPIGYVRWLPVQNQPGHFVERDHGSAAGEEKDHDKIRRFRRYIGIVTEEIAAADGAIRLRDRGRDPAPASSFFQAPTKDQRQNSTNDLVWVEGHLRVVGNAKLCAGKLDFRDREGKDFDIPLTMQRHGDAGAGARALQVTIGPDAQTSNRFAVGPLKADKTTVDEKFVVLSSGNVGIGTMNPPQLLTLEAPEGTRLEIARTSGTLPWSQASGVINEGAFVINQQSKGSSKPDADFALMRDGKKRLTLGNTDTILSSQEGGNLRFYVNLEEPPGEQETMRITGVGNVGIGTTSPHHRLRISGGPLWTANGWLGSLELDNASAIGWQANAAGQRFGLGHTGGGLYFFRTTSDPGTAGAPANYDLVINDSGNVGIGTTSPHHRLRISGGPLWTANGWLGSLELDNASAIGWQANAAGQRFGLGHTGGGLYFFRTTSDPGTAGAPANYDLVINDSGNVGIGTTSPHHRLRISGGPLWTANGWLGSLELDNASAIGWQANAAGQRFGLGHTGGGLYFFRTTSDPGTAGAPANYDLVINDSGNVGIGTTTPSSLLEVAGHLNVRSAYSQMGWTNGSSDETLKKDIVPLTDALNKLSQLRGVQFYWKEPEKIGNLTGPQMGLVAQEVEKVFPEWVTVVPNGYKAITFRGFEALTIEAFREVKTEIESLKMNLQQKNITIGQALMLEALQELKTEIEGCKDRLQKLETRRAVPRRK